MGRLFTVLALVVAVGACSDEPKSALDSLVTPVFIWEHRAGDCGRVRAMDDEGVLWGRQGCGDDAGLAQRGRLDGRQISMVRAAFGRLRDGMIRSAGECPVSAHLFQVFRVEITFDWVSCGTSKALGGLDGLDDVYLDAARVIDR